MEVFLLACGHWLRVDQAELHGQWPWPHMAAVCPNCTEATRVTHPTTTYTLVRVEARAYPREAR